jgi:hypothetical protein
MTSQPLGVRPATPKQARAGEIIAQLSASCVTLSIIGSGVICCGTVILAVTVHGRDARATSK